MFARIISMMNIRILALAGFGIFSIFWSLMLRFFNRRFPSVTPYETQDEKRKVIKEYGYDPVQAKDEDEEPTYVDFLEDRILEKLGEKPRTGRTPAARKLQEITIGDSISEGIIIGERLPSTPDPFSGFDKDNSIKERKETPDHFVQTRASQKQI